MSMIIKGTLDGVRRRVEGNKHTTQKRKHSTNIAIKVITFENFKDPFVDDGLLEVICFKDAWHGNDFLPSKDRGECLVQVS
ncbi:hypothetical protein AAG906_022342 [Vitis piasezkii]